MNRPCASFICIFCCLAASVSPAFSQGRGGTDWAVNGGDAQRSSWVRTDPKISAASMAKPGFQFMWKVKTGGDALSAPSLMERYIGYRGFRSYAFVGGSANNISVFDTDLSRVEWKKHFPVASGAGSGACAGGMMASVTRDIPAAWPSMNAGRGGRGGPAKSGVGAAGEGAVTLAAAIAIQPPPNAGRGPVAPTGPARGRTPTFLHAISTDGAFHSMYVSNGEEPEPPAKFLPANAVVSNLIVVDNVAYAVTSGNCGGAPDGIWALDLATRAVVGWKGAVTGSAFGPDGTVYAATAPGDLVALDAKSLNKRASYSAGQPLTSSPVIFAGKDKTLIAVAAKDGSVQVLDATSLAKLAASPAGAATGGPLATWEDSGGIRWILSGSTAWKFTGSALEPGWTASNIQSPAASAVVNGVVFFAAGTTLHALDAATGKSFWTSGKTIASAIPRQGGLAAGGSAVYLGTADGTFYAFGFPIEH